MKTNLLVKVCILFALLFSAYGFSQPADLEINQFSVSDNTPDEGQSIIYTLKVKNKGPNNAFVVKAQFVLR